MSCKYEYNNITFNTSQELLQYARENNIREVIDNLTPKSPGEGFKQQTIKYLQSQGIVSKKQFPAGSGNYYINKTQFGQDRSRYAAEEVERINLAKIAAINEKYGYPAITTRRVGNGLVVDVNVQMKMFDMSMEERINQDDEPNQENADYINENILTENTGNLVENVYLASRTLNNPDISRIANILRKYQRLLEGTETAILEEDEWNSIPPIAFEGTSADKVGGLYNAADDTIYLNKKYLNTHSLEQVVNVLSEELLHALTVQPLHKYGKGLPMSDVEKKFATEINGLWEYYKMHSASVKKTYRFANTREFLVGMMLDKRFKDHLKDIDKDLSAKRNAEKGFFRKMIDRFVNSVLKFLGVKTNKDIAPFESMTTEYLNQYLDNVDEINKDGLIAPDENMYSTARDVNSEKEVIRTKISQLTDKEKKDFKDKLHNAINTVKSFSTENLNRLDADIRRSLMDITIRASKLTSEEMDQVDYFFSFNTEVSNVFDILSKKADDIMNDKTASDIQKLAVWDRIMSTARVWDPIIDDIAAIKVELLRGDPLAKNIDDLVAAREGIEKGYSVSIMKVMSPLIAELAAPAVSKAMAILDREIDSIKASIALATKHNNQGRVKQQQKELEKKIKERNEKYNVTAENAENWLRGRMGDSNMFSAFIEAAAVSGQLPVAVLDRYIKNIHGEMTPEVLELQNKLQTELDAYSSATGRSINNLDNFYEPLIERYKDVVGIDENDKPIYKEVYTLKNQFKMDYIGSLKEFMYRGGNLRKELAQPGLTPEQRKAIQEKIKINQDNRSQFIKDYMERPYEDKVHDAMDLYDKDLGGFTAAEEFRTLYNDKRDLEDQMSMVINEDEFATLADLLQEKEFRIKQLRSLYEKEPGTKEYKIAELMNERDKKMNEYFEYVLTNSGRAKFEHEKAAMDAKFENGEITKQQRDFWYQTNTQNTLSESYWSTKMNIIGQMNDILKELGATKEKNKDIGDLYNDLRDITKPFRDREGIIDGNKFNPKQLGDVKSIEEKIEKLKNELPNMFGLSKVDRIELSNAYDRLDQIEESLQSYLNPADRRALVEEKGQLDDRIESLSSMKKNFKDKKLLDKYFQLMKKLSDLDLNTTTHYYEERYNKELSDYADNQSVDDIGDKFYDNGIRYEKVGNEWYAIESAKKGAKLIDEASVKRSFQLKKAKDTFKDTDWYKQNHITRTVWEKNESYNPENGDFERPGEWKEVSDTLYVWKQTTPADPSYVLKNEPSLKYKVRRVKQEFRNPKYRQSVDGYNVPRVEGAKDNRFINDEYTRLKNATSGQDKVIYRTLKFLTTTYHDAQQHNPMMGRNGFNLPSIRKSMEERRQATSIGGHIGNLFDTVSQYVRGAKDQLVKNEQDKDLVWGHIDDIGGMIPSKFSGDIDINDQSIDLFRTIGMYTVAALQRRQLVKAYPFAKALYNILSDKENAPVKTKNGIKESIKKKFLPKNTEVAKRIDGESQMAAQVNEMIRTIFFGERMRDQPGAKQISALSGLAAKAMLGLNIGSMIQNFANAKIQSILETEGKIGNNFNRVELAKAEAIYFANLKSLMADMGKYGNKSYINQYIDYFGGLNFNILGKFDNTLAYGKLREGLASAFMPTEIAEKELSSVVFIASGLNTKVNRTINGETTKISLFDAFEIVDGQFKPKEGVEFTQEQKEDYMGRINNSARRINGEYGKLDTVTAQKVIVGRLITFMNKFFVPFFMNRFGKRRLNMNEGIQDDGFWRTFFSTTYNDIRHFNLNVVKNWQYYTPTQKTAMKKVMTEIAVSITLMAVMAALGGGNDPKDINNNSNLVNNMLYVIKGIKRQNEQFMLVPGLGLDDVMQKIKNPLPIASKLVQAAQVLQDAAYMAGYPMGLSEGKDVFYTKNVGWHRKGDWRILSDIGRVLGGPNKVQQILHPDVALKNVNAFRIR